MLQTVLVWRGLEHIPHVVVEILDELLRGLPLIVRSDVVRELERDERCMLVRVELLVFQLRNASDERLLFST